MKQLKSLLAFALALLMVLALGGCTLNKGTTWIAKSGDVTIPAGMYILNLSNSYSSAIAKLQTQYAADAQSVNVKDLWKNNLDGKTLDSWVTDETKTSMKNYIAILNRFNELGFSFDKADQALIDQEIEKYWSEGSDDYLKTGVSKDSIRLQVESRYRSRMIFNSIYGVGGEKSVSDDVLKDYYAKNYNDVQYYSISLKGSDDKALEGDALQKRKDLADTMIARARAGEDFVAILKEAERTALSLGGTAEADLPDRNDDAFDYTISSATKSYYPEALVTAVKEMKAGDMKVITTDTALILVKKLDLMADAEKFAASRESILSQAKNEEFLATVSEWGSSIEMNFNDAAVKRYSAKKMLG